MDCQSNKLLTALKSLTNKTCMSDFLYSTKSLPQEKCQEAFHRVYGYDIKTRFFAGNNCLLAISENIYKGYLPYEHNDHICAVIGGPILKFRDNKFITSINSNEGSKSIFNRWIIDNKMQWDEDMDGPFVVLLFNKHTGDLTLVTDMMSFIPVYQNKNSENILVGTHLNTLDYISASKVDQVSVADFIMNDVVTFPYTVFEGVFQIYPASIHKWEGKKPTKYSYTTYWLPYESDSDEKYNISLLAERLQKGLKRYINSILEANPKVGILMSGGEDSRTILGLMPLDYPKDGIMVTDSLNNDEVNIAKHVAKSQKIDLTIGIIAKDYFPNIFAKCSNLVGVGADCAHVHSFGFHQDYKFYKYDAIFGGFLADTFLKALWARKEQKMKRTFFFQGIEKVDESSEFFHFSNIMISEKVFSQINQRKDNHRNTIKKIRQNSVTEWQSFWPISMQRDIPNIWGHRRLFKNYEPFTANEVIKVAAAAAQKIKANRMLFQKAAKPFLKNTKWIPHNNGFLPYYSHRFNNVFFISFFKVYRKLFQHRNKGGSTWPNYNEVFKLPEMIEKEKLYLPSLLNECNNVFASNFNFKGLDNNDFTDWQKRNILQIAYYLYSRQKQQLEPNLSK